MGQSLEILNLDKLRSYDWANPEHAWIFWLIAAALLWGPMKWAWGRRWALPLHPKERQPLPVGAFVVWLPRVLRAAGLALLLLAMMRPQTVTASSESSVQSIDIYLAFDISGSMQANDVKPNRLVGAKEALKRFLGGVKGDRVGLVVFAGKAFTQCPLTLDHDVVKYFIDQVQFGTVGVDGTALGDGLLLAVQRMIQEPRRGQVIVIATDGRNNAGQDPMAAAKIAAQAGIKVYTVGIGQKGGATMQFKDAWGRVHTQKMDEPDEALMSRMADVTGGRYFRATDEKSLQAVYQQIAKLERREVKIKNRRDADEHFYAYLWLGALLLAGEALLRLRFRVVM